MRVCELVRANFRTAGALREGARSDRVLHVRGRARAWASTCVCCKLEDTRVGWQGSSQKDSIRATTQQRVFAHTVQQPTRSGNPILGDGARKGRRGGGGLTGSLQSEKRAAV